MNDACGIGIIDVLLDTTYPMNALNQSRLAMDKLAGAMNRRQWLRGSLTLGLTISSSSAASKFPLFGNRSELSTEIITRIRNLVEQAIRDGEMCGAVIAIGNKSGLLYEEAFGFRQIEPVSIPMTLDTLFDLASLTKPIVTGITLMRAWEDKLFQLDDPVVRFLPEFKKNGKEIITIEQLLTHQGGLTPDNSLRDYVDGPEEAWKRVCELPLDYQPGTRFRYSDVGFIVLGKLIERLTQTSLDRQFAIIVTEPLGMRETLFKPGPELAKRAVTTEQRDGRWIQGEVHDPRAHAMGGVAGHAGLFSTAHDLSTLSSTLLSLDDQSRTRPLQDSTLARMTSDHIVADNGVRGLAWDKRSKSSTNRGTSFSDSAFGHGGFTGTSLWIDPRLNCYVIFLGNRLHPDGEGSVNRLAGTLGTWVGEELLRQ